MHVQACTWANFCSCNKAAAPCRMGAPAQALENVACLLPPIACPHQAPTNAHPSYLQHHLLLQHQAALDQKVEQREIRVCHWAEKKEDENDKIIACSTLFMRTSFQWYMSAPGESIVSPLTYFKCQGCHARRQWWTSLNRIWYCSHAQCYTLKVCISSIS